MGVIYASNFYWKEKENKISGETMCIILRD